MSNYGQAVLLREMQLQLAPIRGRYVNKYGANYDIDTATTPEFVWTVGGTYSWPSTATAMEIYSTSTADRSASTGAHTVSIHGVDGNWNAQSETVTLNGQAPVNLANTYLRVNRAFVASAGTNEVNVGELTIRTQGGGTTHCDIRAGEGQTLIAIWTVPAGRRARVRRVWMAFPEVTNQSNIIAELWFRKDGVKLQKHNFGMTPEDPEYQFVWPIGGPEADEKTDIYLQVSSVELNNTPVDGGFDLSIEDLEDDD